MMSTFRSLHVLNYRIWFTGAHPNIGMWMQRTAQGWLVFDHLTPGRNSGRRRPGR